MSALVLKQGCSFREVDIEVGPPYFVSAADHFVIVPQASFSSWQPALLQGKSGKVLLNAVWNKLLQCLSSTGGVPKIPK